MRSARRGGQGHLQGGGVQQRRIMRQASNGPGGEQGLEVLCPRPVYKAVKYDPLKWSFNPHLIAHHQYIDQCRCC